jgi:hypothetical protein
MRQQPRPQTRQGAPQGATGAYGSTENPHSPNAKVFVGGLERTSTEDSLAAYFANFGTVMSCEVMRRDGLSRGFGFVVFSSDQEAALALGHPSHLIDGKHVEVKTCQPKEAMAAVQVQAGAYGMMPQYPGMVPGMGMYAAQGMARYRPY